MSAKRASAFVALGAATFVSAGAPGGVGSARSIGAPITTEPAAAEVTAGAVHAWELEETGEPVPKDVTASVIEERAGLRVVVRRPGHAVAVRLDRARAAGRDEAALFLAPGERAAARTRTGPAPEIPVLAWEATDTETLATVRGTVHVEGGVARLAMSPPPRALRTHDGRAHKCVAMDDARGGFTVVCRVKAAAVKAASLTNEGTLDDAWTFDAKRRGEKLVRIDLPLDDAGADAAVIGYRAAGIGVVVTLEASRLAGEAQPRLSLGATEKRQPVPPSFGLRW